MKTECLFVVLIVIVSGYMMNGVKFMIKSNCCNEDIIVRTKGNNLMAYCTKCGKYVKNLNKDERILYEIDKDKADTKKPSTNIISKLKELMDNINNEIDREMNRLPFSEEDKIRKSAYTFGLSKCLWYIEDIINGEECRR